MVVVVVMVRRREKIFYLRKLSNMKEMESREKRHTSKMII